MSVYSLKYPLSSADFTIYAPGIGTLSFTVSSPLWRIQHFAHFAAAIANHYNLAFSFQQVPITAGWTEAAWYERLVQHLYTWLVMCYHCVRVAVGPHRHVCSTRRAVTFMSTRAAPHLMPLSLLWGTERWALAWQPSSLTTGPQLLICMPPWPQPERGVKVASSSRFSLYKWNNARFLERYVSSNQTLNVALGCHVHLLTKPKCLLSNFISRKA